MVYAFISTLYIVIRKAKCPSWERTHLKKQFRSGFFHPLVPSGIDAYLFPFSVFRFTPQYQPACAILALTAVSVFLRLNFLLKLAVMLIGLVSFGTALIFIRADLYGDPLEPEPG